MRAPGTLNSKIQIKANKRPANGTIPTISDDAVDVTRVEAVKVTIEGREVLSGEGDNTTQTHQLIGLLVLGVRFGESVGLKELADVREERQDRIVDHRHDRLEERDALKLLVKGLGLSLTHSLLLHHGWLRG